ncbi:MAG: hypothetical protein JRI55_34755, partial [Deltaproteobacteria bacterium]|nr:hypothetical protein [Deltaproteobacteria bacterium]
ELDADGNAVAPLEVRRLVTVAGQALAGNDVITADAVHARIIFTETGTLLPGHTARITVHVATGDTKYFQVDLLPGSYRITVIPEGSQAALYPVLYLDGVEVTVDGKLRDQHGDPLSVILVPPAAKVVHGIVRRGAMPADGLTVEALNPKNSRLISTTGVTHCPGGDSGGELCGEFSLGLSPGVTEFSLRVSRPDEPNYPRAVVSGFTTSDEDLIDLTNHHGLSFPALGVPIRLQAHVSRPAESSSGEALTVPSAGCLVTFAADDVTGGAVDLWVVTNESGEVEEGDGQLGTNLYPGSYQVTVIPPPAAGGDAVDYAAHVTSEPVAVGPEEAAEIEFQLPWRPQLRGWTVVEGEGVPTSVLLAEPRTGQAGYVRSSTAQADADGAYALWMDFGRYLVTAEAPSQSGYAWGRQEVEIQGDQRFDIELPLPFVARAQVEIEDGGRAAGALVEWYEVFYDDLAHPVASVTADEAGQVTVLLPP